MTETSKAEMGNQALASFMSKSLKVMIPIFLTMNTLPQQTTDWMVKRRKVMEKL
jgi:hypothetical protein